MEGRGFHYLSEAEGRRTFRVPMEWVDPEQNSDGEGNDLGFTDAD